MDIYITEINSGRKIQIPALPQEITCGADGRFATYDILKRGQINFPDGSNLDAVSWEAMFPGEARQNEPWIRSWTSPQELDEILTGWRVNGAALKLVITDSNINIDCFIASYQPTYSGGFGDITYSITFTEKKDLIVTSSTAKKTSSTSNRTTKSQSETYTVKSVDCLWDIAQAHYGKGAEWKKIYNANKDVIEKEAKRRGFSSSNNGDRIWPGTTLSIP
jgi:hypothetical protein